MQERELSTLELIHQAAKAESLEKGFKSASLRQIVKAAGVTTGAFYGYYDSKEALFEALVGKQYTHFMTCFCRNNGILPTACGNTAGPSQQHLWRMYDGAAALRL